MCAAELQALPQEVGRVPRLGTYIGLGVRQGDYKYRPIKKCSLPYLVSR